MQFSSLSITCSTCNQMFAIKTVTKDTEKMSTSLLSYVLWVRFEIWFGIFELGGEGGGDPCSIHGVNDEAYPSL